ncbi:MAG: carbohydrate kinase family protein [Victivallales bacterium]|nr:carbohydrate kinase family protein [Victivallales bacterium]
MRRGLLCAGNWVLDKVKLIDRWPGEGELCNVLSQEKSGGGGAFNVLMDIAAMACGIPLFACGVLGEDSDGDYLMRLVQERGIDVGGLVRSERFPTSSTDVMTVKGTGRRTFFHDRGANAELSPGHFCEIRKDVRIFYLGYLLLLDSLDAHDPEYGTGAARALKAVVDAGCITVVDVVTEDAVKFRDTVPPSLRYTDYLVLNEVEAGNCSGLRTRNADGKVDLPAVEASARHLLGLGVRKTVVIHYPEGAVAVGSDGNVVLTESLPIRPSEILGSVGAGDAFCAGFIYGLHENLDTEMCMEIAGVSAWFNLQSPTATGGAPSLEKILEHIG